MSPWRRITLAGTMMAALHWSRRARPAAAGGAARRDQGARFRERELTVRARHHRHLDQPRRDLTP